jgi:dipeptidyl aminopeptidase/acylaminoacyl peptidase
LKVDTIAPARKVSIAAGDGTILPALLTLPLDPPAGPIGFVVLPHGGPNAHDSLQFDWIVQFIASRGYGVLQPQFRGSSGYGSAFQRAGYREWGGRMQDDVTDATRWLIDQKLADPKRLCIVGSSYGGYAALTGAAQHPDLYRCVAAIAPVTDVEKLLHDREHIEFVEANRNRIAGTSGTVGIPSPVDLAGAISAPVLLIHGKRDFTVPVAHSEEMAARLREAGHKPVVVYIDDSDHFFSHPGGRLQALKALDSFLNANLGADPGRRS